MVKPKVAIVTGAARGIGRAIAERLMHDGFIVAVADMNEASAHSTCEQIAWIAADHVFAVHVDVTDAASARQMVATVIERHGQVDVLVNNAGVVGVSGPVVTYAEDEWRRVLATNLDGTFFCSKAVREVLRALESVGVKFEITGVDNIRKLDAPGVFIGNHMSILETFVLPAIIAPFRDTTFVVKQSLVEYPVFKHVMRSRNPVTVTRTNPREDLRAILEGGEQRLKAGISIVIFPQTTRTAVFDPTDFNSIGVKLAKKAGAPIVPFALKTDAWGNGRYLKDFGRIGPASKVHFAFGEPLWVRDRGREEHEQIVRFISDKLTEWST